MKIKREWAMPNRNTFSIKPIRSLIDEYIKTNDVIIDPFARGSKIGTITNDIDPDYNTTYNMDALEFMRMQESGSADVVLFDPPYSPRQISECYKRLSLTVNMQTTQSSFWGNMKKEIARVVKTGGICITCGWNSCGIGKVNGFSIVYILLVCHGGWHNDTIVTVEQKL
jgi:DNA modification methylase